MQWEYSNLLQQDDFIVVAHLVQGSLHQPGKIFFILDQKRIIPGEQQWKKKSVSEKFCNISAHNWYKAAGRKQEFTSAERSMC